MNTPIGSNFSKRQKVTAGIVAGLIVVGSAVAVYLLILRANSIAAESIKSTRQTVIEATSKANEALADTNLAVTDKRALLANYEDSLNNLANDLCSRASRAVYYGLLSEHDRCERAKESLGIVKTTVSDINAYLVGEAALVAAIPSGTSASSFQESYGLWDKVVAAIDRATVPARLVDQKALLITNITAHRDAWKALVEADSARDKMAFTTAQELVSTTYTTLTTSTTIVAEPLRALSDEFKVNFQSFLTQTNPL